jgi:hypothetical protein
MKQVICAIALCVATCSFAATRGGTAIEVPHAKTAVRFLHHDGQPYLQPSVRITSDSACESNATLAQLENGDILIAYERWGASLPTPDSGCWIAVRRSTDHGQTWSAAETLSGGLRARPVIRKARDGRVWLFWLDGLTALDSARIHYATSGDNGYTWSPEAELPTPINWLCQSSGYLFQPDDQRIWVFYDRNDGTGYMMSSDNGSTWMPDTAAPFAPFGSIVQDSTGELWFFRAGTGPVLYRTSTDTGRTWTLRSRRVPGAVGTPRVVVSSTQAFWLGFSSPPDYPNVFFLSRPAGETLWSGVDTVTTYMGPDSISDVALADDLPWFAFSSDRGGNRDVYCGILGQTADSAPPPYLEQIGTDRAPVQGRTFAAQVTAVDETGISQVELVYALDGTPQPDLELYDDGQHGDNQAGDGCYGNFLGPYPRGALRELSCRARIRDVTGNSILVPFRPVPFEVAGVHDTSNLELYIDPHNGKDGGTGTGYPSCQWPAGSDTNYLFAGHCWVGAKVGSDTLVSDYNPNRGQTDWQTCAGESLRWFHGNSDLDSRVLLDDRQPVSGQPLGIQVNKHSLSWCRHPYDDFIIQEYAVRNTGLHGNLDSVFVGFCYDFDISNASGDYAAHDTARRLSYMYNLSCRGYAGVRMLSGPIRGAHAWSMEAGDPLGDGERYRELIRDSLMPFSNNPADYRVFQTTGPWSIPVGDSIDLAVALIVGPGLSGLQEYSDTAQAVYDRHYVVGVGEAGRNEAPTRLALEAPGPNPLRGPMSVRFSLPLACRARVSVYDVTGRATRTLLDAELRPGSYSLPWDCRDNSGRAVASGIYVVRLMTGAETRIQRVVLVE